MKKKLFFLIIFFYSLKSFSAELDSLSKHTYEGWDNDVTEISYVATRCSALYATLKVYFQENGKTSEDKEYVKTFNKSSEQLGALGLLVAPQIGLSQEKFELRYKEFIKIYSNKIFINKTLNNSAFDDKLFQELKICKTVAETTNEAFNNLKK